MPADSLPLENSTGIKQNVATNGSVDQAQLILVDSSLKTNFNH